MNSRNQSLDVLRGVAVLMVIVCHYRLYLWMDLFRFGVDLFFVLSGFLISGLLFADLENHGRIRVGRFLFRRGFKIYPPLWAFLAITFILWPAVRAGLGVNLTFLQNYLLPASRDWPQGGWDHLWSIAIEEHFYLALPFVLIALARFNKLHWIPAISVTLFAVCLIGRIRYGLAHPQWVWGLMFPTHLRIDALFAGVALGYLFHFERKRLTTLSRWWLPIIALPLLLIGGVTDGMITSIPLFSFSFTFTGIGFFLLVAWAVTRKLRFLPLEFVGQYSYSIYLWHVALIEFFLARKPLSALGLFETIVTCVGLGVIAAKLIEFPALKLRDNLSVNSNSSEPTRCSLDSHLHKLHKKSDLALHS